MVRIKDFLYESFWSIAVIAVVLFAPSSGLISLTVPDEPYGSAVGLPDTSHIGKRVTEDSEHFAFDAAFTTYDIHLKLFALGDIMFSHRNDPYAALVSLDQIRGPPARVNV